MENSASPLVHSCCHKPKKWKIKKCRKIQQHQNLCLFKVTFFTFYHSKWPLKRNFGEYLLTFPTTEPANPRERENYTFDRQTASNNCCYLSISLRILRHGTLRFGKLSGEVEREKPWQLHPGKIHILNPKNGGLEGDWTFQFGDIFKQTSKYLFLRYLIIGTYHMTLLYYS